MATAPPPQTAAAAPTAARGRPTTRARAPRRAPTRRARGRPAPAPPTRWRAKADPAWRAKADPAWRAPSCARGGGTGWRPMMSATAARAPRGANRRRGGRRPCLPCVSPRMAAAAAAGAATPGRTNGARAERRAREAAQSRQSATQPPPPLVHDTPRGVAAACARRGQAGAAPEATAQPRWPREKTGGRHPRRLVNHPSAASDGGRRARHAPPPPAQPPEADGAGHRARQQVQRAGGQRAVGRGAADGAARGHVG